MAEKLSNSSAANQASTHQRRLSFIETDSQANSDHDSQKKRQSQAQQGGGGGGGASSSSQFLNSSMERRQSIWNANNSGGAGGSNSQPRKSVYQQRRMSYALSQGSRKSSQDLSTGYPRIRYQNSYRTEPNSEQERFKPYKLEPKLYNVLEDHLKDKKYDAAKTAQLTKELSQLVMRETRLLMNQSSPRYKLVSHVLVGEMKNQDIRHGSRCLWDNNLDNYVSVVYKNSSLFAVATVFALYYE